MPFDGFISYSHAADGRLAPAVQRGLHRLARPWHRRRALWIFRDQTGLAVTPGLWSSIQTALDGSRYFVLLASPEAARSTWVNREIEHWVATKSPDLILPVVTDGEWGWDPDSRDFTVDSTAVPAALRGLFTEEPLILDLRWARDDLHLSLQHARFRDAIAQLAAPMHGVSKDELEGEDVRQHRRARRMWSAAATLLLVLTLVASVTGVLAVRYADRANAAAADARRQELVASEQRGSAERATQESQRQQTIAQEQEARARLAAAETRRQQQLTREQQELAREAAEDAREQQANAGRQEANAQRQQQLADRATARAARQEQLAEQHRELARQAGAERRRQERIAREQQELARKATEEARRQREAAALQQRIAINRRLMTRSRTMIEDDPKKALMVGVAAASIHSDAQTREQLSHLVMSTHHAGTLSDVINAASVSPQVLVTSDAAGTVSLWNTTRPAKPVRLGWFPAAGAGVQSLTAGPDGLTLAVVDGLSTATLYDVSKPARPTPIAVLPDAAGTTAVTFSPDGHTVATGNRAKNTTLWEVSGATAPLVRGTLPGVQTLTFSPDGKTAVTSGSTVAAWDVSDPAGPVRLAPMSPLLGDVEGAAVTFHPKLPLVAVQERSDYVTLWDLKNPAKPKRDRTETTVNSIETDFRRMAFSPDGTMLAFGDSDGTTLLYALTDAYPWLSSRTAVLNGRDGGVHSMAFSRDGRTLVTSGDRGEATLWNSRAAFATDAIADLTNPNPVNPAGLAFRPDGRSLVAADYPTGTIVPWDVVDPARPVRRDPVPLGIGKVEGMTLSPDGRTMAVIGTDKAVTLLDVTRAQPVRLATIGQDALTKSMTFSEDGKTLAVGRFDRTATLYDVADPARPLPLISFTFEETLWSIAFTADAKFMAVSEGDRVSLWDMDNRAAPVQLSTLPQQGYSSSVIAFSPDGRTLVASRGHIPELWDVADPTRPHRLATLPGNRLSVQQMAFSPDGRILTIAGRDDVMMAWDLIDLNTPVRFATFKSSELQTLHLAVSPDGRTLAAGGALIGRRQTITLWDYSVPKALRADPTAHACTVTGRGLNAEEWTRYVPELRYRATC
jgi:WD40 repeat protein